MSKILFAGMKGEPIDIRTDVPLGKTLYDLAVMLSDGGMYTARDIEKFVGAKHGGKDYVRDLRLTLGIMVFSAWTVGNNFDCYYMVRRVQNG